MRRKLPLPAEARVIKAWETMYDDPLDVSAGEPVTMGKTDPEWPGWQRDTG